MRNEHVFVRLPFHYFPLLPYYHRWWLVCTATFDAPEQHTSFAYHFNSKWPNISVGKQQQQRRRLRRQWRTNVRQSVPITFHCVEYKFHVVLVFFVNSVECRTYNFNHQHTVHNGNGLPESQARPQACVKLNHQKMCALMAATCFSALYRVRAWATFILHYANELSRLSWNLTKWTKTKERVENRKKNSNVRAAPNAFMHPISVRCSMDWDLANNARTPIFDRIRASWPHLDIWLYVFYIE